MSGIKFLSENFAADSTLTLTTGTANSQFPISNILIDSPSIKFRSTGNTAVIEIDLLQTRDIDTVAIAGDPVSTFGLTAASVKTSVTNDFSLSVAATIDLSGTESIGFVSITEVSHRFVEITLTGNGSYAELGNVFIGKAISLTQNSISIASFSYARNDRSSVRTNKYGQKFINKLNKSKTLGGTIEFTTKAEQEELDDMFIRHGKTEPLWMFIDENSSGMNDGKFKLTMYGHLTAVPAWTASGGQLFNATLELEQVI